MRATSSVSCATSRVPAIRGAGPGMPTANVRTNDAILKSGRARFACTHSSRTRLMRRMPSADTMPRLRIAAYMAWSCLSWSVLM